jgi:hypothetical protein
MSRGPRPESRSAGAGTDGDRQAPLERRLAAWMLAGIDGAMLWRTISAESPPIDPVLAPPPRGPARAAAALPQPGGGAGGQTAGSRCGAAAPLGMGEAGDPAGE